MVEVTCPILYFRWVIDGQIALAIRIGGMDYLEMRQTKGESLPSDSVGYRPRPVYQ
jgi:hypothetical protein